MLDHINRRQNQNRIMKDFVISRNVSLAKQIAVILYCDKAAY